MKHRFFISFIVLCLIQLSIPIRMIIGNEAILTRGVEYKVRINPIIPGQMESGEYINIRYHDLYLEIDDPDKWSKHQQVFVIPDKDSEGRITTRDVLLEKPNDTQDYIRTRITRIQTGGDTQRLYFRLPENVFYLNRDQLEKIGIPENLQMNEKLFYALVAVKNGKMRIKSVLIQDDHVQ